MARADHHKAYVSTADEVWRPDTSAFCDADRQPWPCLASELYEALASAVTLIEGLADQQAMPDDFYKPELERIKELLR